MMPPSNQPPMVIDERYRVERLLGAGGMGAVYACKHTGTRRACAVKVILADAARRPQALERFMREASAQGAVKSPNVVDIFDVGQDRATGNAFMAMELLSGEDLGQRIEKKGKLAPDVVLRIAAQGLTGLVAAHEAGVVHRDLKPANLFLARTGKGEHTVKLLDFGIAKVLEDDSPQGGKLTRTGMVFGSPAYMSPEQASGASNVDHRSDVWSFGAVMYEALTGAPPYHDARTLQELITRIWAAPPESLATRAPDVPAEVAAIVTRAMTHEVGGRYQTAAEMREAVLKLLPAGSAITSEMLGESDEGAAAPAGSAVGASGGTAAAPVGGTSGVAALSSAAPGPGSTAASPPLQSGTTPPAAGAPGASGGTSPASPAGGTQMMPGPVGASTQGAFARTGETPPARRWVTLGAITLALAAVFTVVFLQLFPKGQPAGGAASGEPGSTAPPVNSLAVTAAASTSAADPQGRSTIAAPPETPPTATADAGSPAPPATTVTPVSPPPVGPGTRPVIAKPKSTDPFAGKPISKDNKP